MVLLFELHFVRIAEAVGSNASDLLGEMVEDVEDAWGEKEVDVHLDLPIHLWVADLLSSRKLIEGFENKVQDGFYHIEFHVLFISVQLENLLVINRSFFSQKLVHLHFHLTKLFRAGQQLWLLDGRKLGNKIVHVLAERGKFLDSKVS